jgi:hypothetical protein
MPAYEELHPSGPMVRIASRDRLEEFRRTWGQLADAGQIVAVNSVGWYQVGDALSEPATCRKSDTSNSSSR